MHENSIILELNINSESTEWIRITSNGFWVRGAKVPQDEQEAEQVYNAFKEFLTWAYMTRQY